MGVGITSLLGWPGLTRGRWRGTPYSHVLGAPCWGSATLVLGWTRGPVRSLHALRGRGAAQEVGSAEVLKDGAWRVRSMVRVPSLLRLALRPRATIYGPL